MKRIFTGFLMVGTLGLISQGVMAIQPGPDKEIFQPTPVKSNTYVCKVDNIRVSAKESDVGHYYCDGNGKIKANGTKSSFVISTTCSSTSKTDYVIVPAQSEKIANRVLSLATAAQLGDLNLTIIAEETPAENYVVNGCKKAIQASEAYLGKISVKPGSVI